MPQANDSVDILRKDVGPGDLAMSFQEFNAISASVRATQRFLPGGGTLDGSASATRLPPTVFREGWFQVHNDTGAEIAQFSAFRIKTSTPAATGQQLIVTIEVDTPFSGYPYTVTNGDKAIPDGRTGWCRAIDSSYPVKVISDQSNPIIAGQFCGSNNLAEVDTVNFGLMALGDTFSEGSKDFGWVIESPKWPMLARATTAIVAATEACVFPYSFGTGTVNILGSSPGTVEAKDPDADTVPWTLTVLNPHETLYPIDQLMIVQEILNFGLMIQFVCPCVP